MSDVRLRINLAIDTIDMNVRPARMHACLSAQQVSRGRIPKGERTEGGNVDRNIGWAPDKATLRAPAAAHYENVTYKYSSVRIYGHTLQDYPARKERT